MSGRGGREGSIDGRMSVFGLTFLFVGLLVCWSVGGRKCGSGNEGGKGRRGEGEKERRKGEEGEVLKKCSLTSLDGYRTDALYSQ